MDLKFNNLQWLISDQTKLPLSLSVLLAALSAGAEEYADCICT